MARWGYPYVMEQFRFHLTLTDRIADKGADHLHRHRAVAQPLQMIEQAAVKFRQAFRHIKPAIGRHPGEQDIGKALRRAAAALCLTALPTAAAQAEEGEVYLHDLVGMRVEEVSGVDLCGLGDRALDLGPELFRLHLLERRFAVRRQLERRRLRRQVRGALLLAGDDGKERMATQPKRRRRNEKR